MAKEKKYLTARKFCEIVLDKKIKLPKGIDVHRKKKQLNRLFGWFELIRSCNHYSHFQIVTAETNICEKIEEMKVTEKELPLLLAYWELWKELQGRMVFKSDTE